MATKEKDADGEKSEVKILLHERKMNVGLIRELKVETRDQQQFLEGETEEKTSLKASRSRCPLAKQETGGEEVQSRKRRTRSSF